MGFSIQEGHVSMSVLVRIPTPLRTVTKGQGELKTEAATIHELIEKLDQEYTGIKARLCGEDGNIRRFINVYVNEEDIRFLQGPATPLKAGDEVSIVPAIAGGAGHGTGIRAIPTSR
jgi:molybdopterin synthase sulfur carrier subunit